MDWGGGCKLFGPMEGDSRSHTVSDHSIGRRSSVGSSQRPDINRVLDSAISTMPWTDRDKKTR